ncbi:MAG TPA: transcription elongation factor GreA [Candidatus Limnocylindria bacterium]|nr:transcription elongation factor GreA [Candidatus Limnocylindria bacterium]
MTTWLTQEAYDRLKAEYDHATTEKRAFIVKRIEAAREEGDLKENGGYHAAKDEQGKNEARIRQLRQLLENSHIGEAPSTEEGVVGLGQIVTVDLMGDPVRFLLGSREVAPGEHLDVYSEKSPLGAAVFGASVGDTVTYTAPNGRAISAVIQSVEPYTG